MTDEPAVRDVPLSGGAALRGPAGTLTVQWLTFGGVSDAELTDVDMFALPDGPIDPKLAEIAGQTLTQVADDLARQGVKLRFTGEHRPKFPDRLVQAVAHEARFTNTTDLTQYRLKVEGDVASGEAPEGVAVVPFHAGDGWDAFARLHQAAMAASFNRCMDTADGVKSRLEQSEASGLRVWVVPDPEIPGQFVGSVGLVLHRSGPTSPAIGEISLVAVDPDWRRRGLGAHLVRHALTELAADDVRTAMAYVDASDDAATAFFEQLGFKGRATRTYYSA